MAFSSGHSLGRLFYCNVVEFCCLQEQVYGDNLKRKAFQWLSFKVPNVGFQSNAIFSLVWRTFKTKQKWSTLKNLLWNRNVPWMSKFLHGTTNSNKEPFIFKRVAQKKKVHIKGNLHHNLHTIMLFPMMFIFRLRGIFKEYPVHFSI